MKEAKNKNKIKKEISASLVTLTVILITLGATLPLHFIFPDKLTVYWVIAICVAVISPFALANFKIHVEAKDNYTDEQKKAASVKIGLAMLSVWYVDFTFICMFMDWLVAFFILAGLYLVKMVYNVAKVLINRKDSVTYSNFIVVGDFVLCFLLMILLIYKIPDANLQTIVTALTAALIGGLLTLLGVMFTIKKSDRDRKEEETRKARPLLFIVNREREQTKDFLRVKVDDLHRKEKTFEKGKSYIMKSFLLKNADYSFSCLKGICVNDDIMAMNIAQVLDKEQMYACICDVAFRYEKEIKNIYLLISDMLDNYYALEVNFQFAAKNGSRTKEIEIISGIELFKAKVDFENLIMMKEAK